jgi:2-dehydropantoate 2-reductase
MAKILIIGAGVIGSVYGAKLIKSGNDVSFLAQGNRLKFLQKEGLIVEWLKGRTEHFSNVRCFSEVPDGGVFDFVLVTVRNENLPSVYPMLGENLSSNIVFMVNNPAGSKEYLKHVDKERLIIGFPGAGGEISNGVVHGHIVAGFIQPTTFGQISPKTNDTLNKLNKVLKGAGFPVSIESDMDSWLLNHLAMVCPLGNAIYAASGDNYTASKNSVVMMKSALALKESFSFLQKHGYGITPSKFKIFIYIPTFVMAFFLKLIFNTQWADTVIASHALNAPNEMKGLSDGFLSIVHQKEVTLPALEELASYNS